MRRALDFYETPHWMTRALLAHHPIKGRVMEPCSGDGSIATVLLAGGLTVDTNDIDERRPADTHCDARTLYHGCDWVITNPPYEMPLCLDIVKQSLSQARVGVAMMLRLSFMEPTKLRGAFWKDNPLTKLLVLPRHSFTGNGKSDSVTTAWMVWMRGGPYIYGNPIVSLDDAKAA